MSVFDTQPERLDADPDTLQSQRLWKATAKQDLDFESQRLRARLRSKMFGVDASPINIGRFNVLETVGSGGMGVVYAAYDEQLDRRVAVKLLRPSREDDASLGKSRLLREAQALAKLSHPNVVQIYEVGTFNERVFLAMEFLPGPTLRAWQLDKPRDWREVLDNYLQAGQGLAAAHREGIIHRDFKPANLLFGANGRVRVVDFGLARSTETIRLVEDEAPSSSDQAFSVELTQTGELMGTPAYMSPEQARYESIDARSDQFSFCVALYEALFGQRPHKGNSTAEILVAISEGQVVPPPRNSKIPAHITRAMMRGLSVEPADRFASMDQLLAELSPQSGGQRWRWVGGGALVVAGLGTALFVGEPPCPSFSDELQDVWGAEQSQAVHAAFTASGSSFAESTASLVDEQLDDYAREWTRAREEACDAHAVRRETSDELYDLQVGCLFERRAELNALTSAFLEVGRDVVGHAGPAVTELSPLSTCMDHARLRGQGRLDPALQDLREQLAEAQAQYKAGRYEQALASSQAVLEAAEARGVAAIQAAALFHRGVTHDRRHSFQAAVDDLEQSIDLAEGAGDDELSSRIWSQLSVELANADHHQLAGRAVRRARAAVLRLGGHDDELRLLQLEAQAIVTWRAGRPDDALQDQNAVLAGYRERYGATHPKVADAMRILANMYSSGGHHQDAQRYLGEALEIYTATYSSEHPRVADVIYDRAIDQREAGELKLARASFQEAERRYFSALGPQAPQLISVSKALGHLALQAGELDEAARRSKQLYELSSPGSGHRVDALAQLAMIAGARGDRPAAIENYREYLALSDAPALRETYVLERLFIRHNLGVELHDEGREIEAEAILRATLAELDAYEATAQGRRQPLPLVRASTWLRLGQITQGREDSRPAIKAFESGLAVWHEEPDGAEERKVVALLRWALAQQLEADDPSRAVSLAEQARATLAAVAPEAAEPGEIQAWLDAQPK